MSVTHDEPVDDVEQALSCSVESDEDDLPLGCDFSFFNVHKPGSKIQEPDSSSESESEESEEFESPSSSDCSSVYTSGCGYCDERKRQREIEKSYHADFDFVHEDSSHTSSLERLEKLEWDDYVSN